MATAARSKRWNVKRRLEFIEFRLFWDGRVNRSDLIDFFGISTPQASEDFRQYSELAHKNLEYDHRQRAYVASADFAPQLTQPMGNQYLAQLRLLDNKIVQRDETWLGLVPPFSTVPTIVRRVESDALRTVISAINKKQALHLEYQSLSRDHPIWRWITPHALAFDGFRWHVRAWCHMREQFQDFVFARILNLGDVKKGENEGANDIAWNTLVTYKIGPHPQLEPAPKRAIEMDYGMSNGVLEVTTRIALGYYFERRMNFDLIGKDIDPERQQVILLNVDETEELKNIVKSKIKAYKTDSDINEG